MKIICHKGIRIVYDDDKQTIKTPIGVFNDIKDAIDVYPILTEVKRVKQCPICGNYFLDKATNNNGKYCSEKCIKKATSIRINGYYYDKIFVRRNPFKPDHYTQSLKDVENRKIDKNNPIEYMQDDTYWGLGTGNLTGTPAHSFEKEKKYVRNELKRLGLR